VIDGEAVVLGVDGVSDFEALYSRKCDDLGPALRLRHPRRRWRGFARLESVQDARIYIELINYPMLFKHKATAAEYKAGLDLAIERGWLELHESGTYVRLLKTEAAN
jgi:hypothetical protein